MHETILPSRCLTPATVPSFQHIHQLMFLSILHCMSFHHSAQKLGFPFHLHAIHAVQACILLLLPANSGAGSGSLCWQVKLVLSAVPMRVPSKKSQKLFVGYMNL